MSNEKWVIIYKYGMGVENVFIRETKSEAVNVAKIICEEIDLDFEEDSNEEYTYFGKNSIEADDEIFIVKETKTFEDFH